MAFVMRATLKHMLRCIDVSIHKTNARWKEFKEDPEKSTEVMTTVMKLHSLRTLLEDFQKTNAEDFKEKSNG